MLKNYLLIGGSMMLISACATYYETSYNFNQKFEQGNITAALDELKADKQYTKGINRFLYYVNRGLILSMMGKYEESNRAFEKAYLFGEDYKVNYFTEAASYFSNPMITVYRGEDHEHLMPLYYKAINFLKMGKHEEALVECRRLNIRLQQLSDKYKSADKYKEDAFIHTLMGIIYQATDDWNNAFIAYRNALTIYERDYEHLFNIQAPEQLKKDLLRSAWNTGFTEEFNFYKEKFGWPEFTVETPEAELVFFWHNGLSPIKEEWSINFMVDHNNNNVVVFNSEGMPFSFPYDIPEGKATELSDLEAFRVAFPKYTERPAYFTTATITQDSITYELQQTEDINKIAFKCLQERMVLEFSKALMRAALKKAAEQAARKEDESLGAIVGIVNAITEKADTRNWQTLPHSIYYTRVPLRVGGNTITFQTHAASSGENNTNEYRYTVHKGQTIFHTYTSLESFQPR